MIDCLSLYGDLLSRRFAGDFCLKAAFVPSHLICYRIIVDLNKPIVPHENAKKQTIASFNVDSHRFDLR